MALKKSVKFANMRFSPVADQTARLLTTAQKSIKNQMRLIKGSIGQNYECGIEFPH